MKTNFIFMVRWLSLWGLISAVLCGTPKSSDPFVHAFANPADNPNLPRVLILGDSISIGYTSGSESA